MIKKVFKLKGLDYFVIGVTDKNSAVIVALANRIGITENDLVETDYKLKPDVRPIVVRSEEELLTYLN